jgi:hypothetical protein
MLYHYGLLTLAFFYTSRFMNENYLGFLLAIVALGFLGDFPSPSEPATPSSQS